MNKLTGLILGLCVVTIGLLGGFGKVEAAAVVGLIGTIVNAILPGLVQRPPAEPPAKPPTSNFLNGGV